ncbi:MAG: hypothetical protein M3271_02930 [Actinomycetota bacterium]|nr:hypothetical protein [Actinomycetota bacterium]
MDLDQYVLEWEVVGDAGTKRVFETLLDVHGPRLSHAFVDAITDEPDLPATAARAKEELEKMGAHQRLGDRPRSRWGLVRALRGDPNMAVELDLQDADDLRILRDFGLFSIHMVAYLEDDDVPEIMSSDTGTAFTFFADEELIEQLVRVAKIPRAACVRIT